MEFDIDKNVYRLNGELYYDAVSGELLEVTEDVVQQAYKVRRALRDEMLVKAVIVELEKLGYTVIEPEA